MATFSLFAISCDRLPLNTRSTFESTRSFFSATTILHFSPRSSIPAHLTSVLDYSVLTFIGDGQWLSFLPDTGCRSKFFGPRHWAALSDPSQLAHYLSRALQQTCLSTPERTPKILPYAVHCIREQRAICQDHPKRFIGPVNDDSNIILRWDPDLLMIILSHTRFTTPASSFLSGSFTAICQKQLSIAGMSNSI